MWCSKDYWIRSCKTWFGQVWFENHKAYHFAFNDIFTNNRTILKGRKSRLILVVLMGITLMFPISQVKANVILDRILDIYQLPGNVENLQKQYEETKQQYEETKQKFTETKQQMEEQKEKLLETTRKALETEQLLLNQNRQLESNNKVLQERVKVMEQLVQAKDKRFRLYKNIAITLIALLILYFLGGRLFRVLIWQRNKRNSSG